MIVEDSDFQRAVAIKVLEDFGCGTVLSAANGDEALRQIVNHSGRVHIVLSDLDMPGMDSMEFLRRLAEGDQVDAVAITSVLDESLVHTVEQMVQAYGIQVLTNAAKPLTRQKVTGLSSSTAPSTVPINLPMPTPSFRPAR